MSAKVTAPIKLATLRRKTKPSPGGETAWKHSSSPMPRKPTATICAFRSECSRLEASSTKAIAMAANPPRASREE